jgi:hypothetical protein
MASSTLPPASSDRWRLIALWVAVIGGPLVALMLLQTNYVLAYPSCGERSDTMLMGVGGGAIVLAAALTIAAWRGRRRADDPPARAFLGTLGVLMSLGFLIVVMAMAVPPLILHPCD